MNVRLLYMFLFGLFVQQAVHAQTNLFSEDFEGTGHAFTLNTADVSSTSGTSGNNYWVVNNAFTGGSGTVATCLGSFGFTIPNTPTQPAGVTNNPTSNYMHIISNAAVSNGINCASFIAADGFCTNNEYNFSAMNSDINTSAYDSVEISFYWTCTGGNESYGELYYSTNSGAAWTKVTSQSKYNLQGNWGITKVSIPAFAMQSTIRFGFRFVNEVTFSTSEPSFSLDEIHVTGFTLNSIAAPTVTTGTSYCPGDAITVNYTVGGSFNAGNVFNLELSDAAGSFASPTVIGTVTATTSGSISGTIPLVAAAGSGYRVRVVGNNPATTGADNGANLTISAGPVAGTAAFAQDSICSGSTADVTLAGNSGTISWQISTNGTSFTGTTFSGTSFTTSVLTQTTYLRAIVTNTCGADTSNVIMVTVVPRPAASFSYSQSGTGLDITFTNNSSGNYTSVLWSYGDGNQTSNDNPTYTYSGVGSYVVTLTVTNDFGCTNSFSDTIQVNAVSVELNEQLSFGDLQVYPNPNDGDFTIQFDLFDSEELSVQLIDVTGRVLWDAPQGLLPAGEHTIAAPSAFNQLADGLYILKVQAGKQQVHRKVVIQQ